VLGQADTFPDLDRVVVVSDQAYLHYPRRFSLCAPFAIHTGVQRFLEAPMGKVVPAILRRERRMVW
jgi:hypothetical protein